MFPETEVHCLWQFVDTDGCFTAEPEWWLSPFLFGKVVQLRSALQLDPGICSTYFCGHHRGSLIHKDLGVFLTFQEGCFLNIYFGISVKGGIVFTCVFIHLNAGDDLLLLLLVVVVISLAIFSALSGRDFWTRMEVVFYLALSEIIFFPELLFVVLVPSLTYLIAYSTEENKFWNTNCLHKK